MELDHTEAIKQGVMAGLGVAFVSVYAVRGEIATGRLHAYGSEAFGFTGTFTLFTTRAGG
jgi:DNA-binding transcriptional LysR family regulator